jgi:transposase
MRVTTAFCRLLDLSGVSVRSVSFDPGRVVVVTVALRRRRLHCPRCSYSTRHRENKQHHDSVWRHLDLGRWRLEVHARLRRLRCPEHGVHVEGVPFARDGARFTRDFENLVVRHEAPVSRVGCRSPPPGCRSSSVKRGAA